MTITIDKVNYELVNDEKATRAIEGMIAANGSLAGGVGEDATDLQKIAEYDRLGGLIKAGPKGYKVKTGSFYDFSKKEPRKEPEVTYIFRDLQGDEIEVPATDDIPLEVKAVEAQKEKKASKKEKKAATEGDETEE